jgi:hypothetical protein
MRYKWPTLHPAVFGAGVSGGLGAVFAPWSTTGVIVPFSLRLTSPRRLLLVSLADDPVYADLEVQWVDEPDLGGAGLVLLAVRRSDATTDVQVDERVRLPRADYEVAAGTRSFRRVPFAPGRFEVDQGGVDLDLGTTLPDGRALTVRIRERLTGPRWAVDMLAPAGAGMTRPRFFPFFWMGEIGFLRWRGATVEVRVDGTPRRVVRVGVPWRLVRYATAPMTAVWNEATDSPVTDNDEMALTRLAVQRGGHVLSVQHDPAFPDVATMRPGATASGRVSACVDGRAQFGGRWWARRKNESAEIEIILDRPWDPGPQPALARAVFSLLRVFRTWPTTYRWQATVDLSQHPPTIRGAWSRTS